MRDALDGEPQLARHLVEPAPAPLLAPIAADRLGARAADGLDLILEGFLLHHGTPLHLDLPDIGQRVLAGDFCYAAGLVRVTEPGDLWVISALAELISVASGLVARDRRDALVPLWVGTAQAIADPAARPAHASALEALREADDAAPLAALADAAAQPQAEARLAPLVA